MRVYLASTPAALRGILGGAMIPAGRGWAVTPSLRAAAADGGTAGTADVEELEYLAMLLAADGSVDRLRAEQGSGDDLSRRVVLAVDVDEPLVRADAEESAEPGSVSLTGAAPLLHLAAAHIDDDDTAALLMSLLADPDVDAAACAVRLEGRGLLWYAVQELAALLSPSGDAPAAD